jgi:O-antigen ligase
VAAATSGRDGPASSTSANRLVSVQSNRYAYWKVAAEVFAAHPLRGVGSGSFQVEWLKRRKFAESVRDAHSIYLETAAELGVIGVAALAAFLAGVVLAAREALRRQGAAAAGAVAAVAAFGLHAGLDWDWEMPALSLVALLLIARLVAVSEA